MGEVIELASRRPKDTAPPPAEAGRGEGEVYDIERQVLTRLESLLAAYGVCRRNLSDTETDIKRYSALQGKSPEVAGFVVQLIDEQKRLARELKEMADTLETLKSQAESTRERKRAARA